jgi:hypothetical protein
MLFDEDDLLKMPGRATAVYEEETFPSQVFFDLWHIITSICNKMPEVTGGMLTLEDILNINKATEPLEVEVSSIKLYITPL